MQNNQQQEERVRPKLLSAEDLKGKKAAKETSKKSMAKRRTAILVALAVALGCVIGGMIVVDKLKPVEPEPEHTFTDTTIQMIEGRVRNDLDRLTVYHNGEKQYTVVSHLQDKADAQAALAEAEAAAAEQAAQDTAETAALNTAPVVGGEEPAGLGSVEDVLNNVVGALDIAGNTDQAEEEVPPMPEELPELVLPGMEEATEAEPAMTLEEIAAQADFSLQDMPWFDLNASMAGNMVTYSYTMIANRVVEENAEDLAPYGLAEPQLEVVYEYRDGTSSTLHVGNRAVGNYYYVTLNDSRDVYMVYGNVFTYNAYSVSQLCNMPVLPVFDTENVAVSNLLVEQKGKETVELHYFDSSENRISFNLFRMTQPIEYDVHSDRTTELENDIAAVALTAYAGHIGYDGDAASYGLAEPAAYVEMLDVNGQKVTYTLGDVTEDGLRYLTIDETGNVYTADNSLFAFLDKSNVNYLVDQFAGLVYIKRIDGFEITTPDTVYTAKVFREDYLDEEGKEKTNETYEFEGQYADKDVFRDFYQVVIGALFDKRLDDPAEWHLEGDADVTVTYHMNYTDEPFVVEYVSYDRDYYAIRREGVTLFLIRKSKIDSMVDTAEAYRNGEYDGAHDTFSYDDIEL